MAFSSYNTQFTRVGPPNDNCPTIWTYIATEATLSTVAASGYFNAVANKLKPGDLIWTGTPTGAGVHRNPSVWLKPGDVVEVSSPQIGVLRNPVVDEG